MRRTLIIGLGSTGRDICDDILTRILWSSGNNSLDKVPWVNLLVLETEQKDGIPSTQHGKFVSLVPDPGIGEVRAILTQPATFEESLDLSRWVDLSLLKGLPAISKGAGGMRMAGRLAFLTPSVYHRVKKSIETSLKALMRTTQNQVNDLLKLEDGVTLENTVEVLLVGTLCGGTASGCFLDAAYLIRNIADDLGYTLDLQGYFTLPPLDTGDKVMAANTFAALQEWNHFLTLGTTYRVRYPDGNGKDFVTDEMPFDRSYLLQTSPEVDYSALKSRTGDYLYSLSTSLDFSAISGKIVDGAVFMNGLDKQGATRRWATLGISTLEFPAERLSEGCSLKLVQDTLERLLAPAPVSTPETMLDKAGLTASALKRALGVEPLKEEIRQRIENQSEALPVQASQALALARTPDTSPGLSGLTNGYVTTKIGGRVNDIRLKLPALIGNDALLDPELSVPTLAARLEKLKTEIRAEVTRIERADTAGNTASAKEALEQTFAPPPAGGNKGCLGLFGRKPSPKPQAGLPSSNQRLKELTDAVVEEHFHDVRLEIYGAALDLIQLWQGRLDGLADRAGVRQHLEGTRDRVAGQLRQVRSTLSSLRASQVAQADIDEEYQNLLLHAARNASTVSEVEREWQKDIIQSLNIIPAELLKFKGESLYDTVRDKAALGVRVDEEARDLTARAQNRFTDVLKTTIIDRLNDSAAALRWLGNVQEMLSFNRTEASQIKVEEKQNISFLFYDQSAVAAAAADQRVRFERDLLALDAGHPNLQKVNGVDLHRISLVKDFSGFSINAVTGCERGGKFRKAFDEMQGQSGLKRYSRCDISWMPITGAEMKKYQRSCQMFLAGLASGVIESKGRGRNEFHYRVISPVTVRLDSLQWMDNGATLYDDEVASNQLAMRIQSWAKEVGPEKVVVAMRDYSKADLPVSGLVDGDMALTDQDFRQAVFHYWRPYQDVEAAFYRMDEAVDPAQQYYRKAGQTVTMKRVASKDGYYCLTCENFLGADDGDNILYNPCPFNDCPDKLLTDVRVI